jgi:hypothetical protein
LSPEQRVAWYNVVGLFQKKAQEFEAAQARLKSMRVPASLEAERRALLARADVVRATVVRIRGALDDVQAALRGAWGLVTGAWDTARAVVGLNGLPPEPLGALGIAPLIPIALVAAAIATVTVFLTSYAKFIRKAELLERGYTPEQIAATDPDRPFGGGMLAGVAGIVALIAAALIVPPVLRALSHRREGRS